MKSFTAVLALLPVVALAAPQASPSATSLRLGNCNTDQAGDDCIYEFEGFNGPAATYLASVLNEPRFSKDFDMLNTLSSAPAPVPSGINANNYPALILSAALPALTAVPESDRTYASSIINQVLSLQNAAPGTVDPIFSSNFAAQIATLTGAAASSATAAANSTGMGAAKTTGAAGSGSGSGGSGANSTMSTHNAAARPTAALGAMAGVLVGVAGLAAAL